MKISIFTIGAIVSALTINSVFATGENIVASKSYVDTKQIKLHAANANPANNGTTVVTYTDTEGTPGERGIYDGSTTYSAATDSDSLITAGALGAAVPSIETTKLTCANQNDGCTLWTISDQYALQGVQTLPSCSGLTESCSSNSDCCGTNVCDSTGRTPKCIACKANGVTAANASLCCSGERDISGVCCSGVTCMNK